MEGFFFLVHSNNPAMMMWIFTVNVKFVQSVASLNGMKLWISECKIKPHEGRFLRRLPEWLSDKATLESCHCLIEQWQVYLNYTSKSSTISPIFLCWSKSGWFAWESCGLTSFLGVLIVEVSGSALVFVCSLKNSNLSMMLQYWRREHTNRQHLDMITKTFLFWEATDDCCFWYFV